MYPSIKLKTQDKIKEIKKQAAGIAKQEMGEFQKSILRQTIAPETGTKADTGEKNPIVEAMQQKTHGTVGASEQDIQKKETRVLNYLERELDELKRRQEIEQEQKKRQEAQMESNRKAQMEAQAREFSEIIPKGIDRRAKAHSQGHQTKGTQELPKKVGG